MVFDTLYTVAGTVAWFFVAIFINSTGTNQLLTTVFFDIPTTLKFSQGGYLNTNAPLVIYAFCALIFALTTAAGIWFGLNYAAQYLNAFYAGLGISTLLGLSDLFSFSANLQDYMETNAKYLTPAGRADIEKQYPCAFSSQADANKGQDHRSNFRNFFRFRLQIGKL